MPVKIITFRCKIRNFIQMIRPFLLNEPPFKQLLFSGLIIIACWIVFQMFSYITGLFIFGISISDIPEFLADYKNPVTISFLKYIQVFTSFGMFIFSAYVIGKAISGNWVKFLTLDKRPGIIPLFLSVLFIIFVLPFTNLLTYLNDNMDLPGVLTGLENFFRSKETQMQEIMELFLDARGIGGLLINLFVIAMIPAIGEELIFRGIIQNRFIAWFRNIHLSVFLSAFIFSALHVQFFSFLPRFMLGVTFGYIFIWSKSIWITINAHFFNNAMAVIYYHYFFMGKADKKIEVIGTIGNGLIYSITGLIAGTIVLFLIYIYYRKKGRI